LAFANQLLNALDPGSIAQWRDALERVPLPFRTVLTPTGAREDWIYFVESGLISSLSEYEPGRMIEVGMVGPEGMHDPGFVLGDEEAAFENMIQGEGHAYRMPRATFLEAMKTDPSFSMTMQRFARAFELQVASTASANGRALLEQRLSRWLLMVQDRLRTTVFEITHEFLSQMLCTRRPGVTVALHLLEGKGYIVSTRGRIEIRNRDGLIEEANGSYGKAEAHYARLLGWDFRNTFS
jgi:CRP-like cAMP-binding protein